MEGSGRSTDKVAAKMQEVEEKVARRERYLREMREEVRRRATTDSGSIEGQITAAEREYEVERVQLELLDLRQELLKLRCEAERVSRSRGQPLSTLLGEEPAVVVASRLSGDQVEGLVVRSEGGLEAEAGERVLEVEGRDVTGVTEEGWGEVRAGLGGAPCTAVILKKGGSGGAGQLREDISLIQVRWWTSGGGILTGDSGGHLLIIIH